MNLLTLTYHSTNYYALEIKGGKLLVDCGWPGSLPEFSSVAKRMGMELRAIKYILATHYHPDHASTPPTAADPRPLASSFILHLSSFGVP